MTNFRTTAIAAIAAITVAASMASPANALSNKAKWGLGIGLSALAIGAATAHAHGHRHGYYDDDYAYSGGRHYRRSARKCARRWGWHTPAWEDCMERRGY